MDALLERLGAGGGRVFSVAPAAAAADADGDASGGHLLEHLAWPCTLRTALLVRLAFAQQDEERLNDNDTCMEMLERLAWPCTLRTALLLCLLLRLCYFALRINKGIQKPTLALRCWRTGPGPAPCAPRCWCIFFKGLALKCGCLWRRNVMRSPIAECGVSGARLWASQAGMPATFVAAPSVAHVVCGGFTLRTATFVSQLPHVQMLVQLLMIFFCRRAANSRARRVSRCSGCWASKALFPSFHSCSCGDALKEFRHPSCRGAAT